MKVLIGFTIFFTACQKPAVKEANTIQDLQPYKCKSSITEKIFVNPVFIEGSDFLSFFSKMKMAFPGKLDTLLVFTSKQSKILHTRQSILELYSKTNLNFKKKLKAMRKVNDTMYVLNYSANKFATTSIVTCSVIVESDTARMILPSKLNDFLK